MKPNRYNYNNQSGMYRNKIMLRQRVVIQDELFQDIETYIDYGTFWAMVKTSNSREQIEGGQESTEIQKRYVIKYSKRLDEFINAEKTTFEVIHNGVTFDVKEAINDNDLSETVTIYVEGRV